MGISAVEVVAAVVAMFVAAAVQGTIGLGFNILAVPVVSLINPLLAPVPQLITSVPQTAAAALRERGGVDYRGVGWILAGRLPGALIGVWLLAAATARALDVMIGVLVLIAVAILAKGIRLRRSPRVDFGAGVFAGISSYVSSIGGPPVALLYSRDEGPTVRATLGLIFLVGSSVTLVTRILAGDITRTDIVAGLALMPATWLGFWVSNSLRHVVSPESLRKGILVVSALAAAALLARGALA